MRVGSVVFSTEQGLGILAKSFWDHGILTDVVVLAHGRRPDHLEWYPEQKFCRNTLLLEDMGKYLVDCCDTLLFFETPFHWPLIDYARSKGKKTVLMPMYECMPKVLPAVPNLFLCPSKLDEYWVLNNGGVLGYGQPGVQFLSVPVEVPWRKRGRAEVFVHNAGHGGLGGRNGTAELIEAWKQVKSPARLILRTQQTTTVRELLLHATDDRISYECYSIPYERLYVDGDVFIFPEKFNGLSLPLQEARAAGMLVMATDRFPMNNWLPTKVRVSLEYAGAGVDAEDLNPLIPVQGYKTSNVSPRCVDFQEAIVDPKAIAAKIDEWYGKDISVYSEEGRQWAASMSWDVLGPKYKEILS